VRILVIAPTILRATLAVVNKINYPVDLIEVKRWVEGADEFLLVNKLEEDPQSSRSRRPVSGLRLYDAAFYKSERSSKSVDEFLRCIHDVEKLVIDQGWNLETKYNRRYCGFKAGFFNAFGVGWWNTKTFGIFALSSHRGSYRDESVLNPSIIEG
jgi:hypothetical protein